MTRVTLLLVTALVATATAGRLGANGHGMLDGAMAKKAEWAKTMNSQEFPSSAELKQKIGELKGKAASLAAEKKAAWGKKGGEKDAEGKWSFLFKGMLAKLKEGKGKKDWGKKDWGKKDWHKKGKKGSRRPQWSEAMLQAFA